MGIWSNLCRLSASVFSGQNRRSTKGKPETAEPRGLKIEQFEDRILLSVSPSSAEYMEALRAYSMQNAISAAADLTRYTDQQLDATDKWVIGLADGTKATDLAHSLGADNLNRSSLLENFYVWEFSTNTSWREAAARLGMLDEVEFFYPLTTVDIQTFAYGGDDPLYQYQWHLENNGQMPDFTDADSDINVVGAWEYATGKGVTIAIIDDSVEYRHEDLSERYLQAYSWDYIGNDNDPSPANNAEWYLVYDENGNIVDYREPGDSHGTAVAGLALASGDNGLGGTGVAFDADYAAIRLIGGAITQMDTAYALGENIDVIDIYSNSWGPGYQSYGIVSGMTPMELLAVETGVLEGRDGLGCIYVFAAGNELREGGDVNYNGYANSIYTIAVAATDLYGRQTSYSSRGSALFISAPASGVGPSGLEQGVTTTDRTGEEGYNFTEFGTELGTSSKYPNYDDLNYTSSFNGTSAATPIVSGVIALMLDANPNLTYRDVQYILQETAYKTDPTDEEWVLNGAGNWVNYKYGFGLIDATAAVEAALNWDTVGPTAALTTGTIYVNQPVPDNSAGGASSSVQMGREIGFIEHVEVKVNIPHMNTGDLEVILISPSGTESYLAEVHDTSYMYYFGMANGYNQWTFTTTRCWGEMSGGEWQLIVRDRATGNSGIFLDWELTIHGTEGVTSGPNLMAVFPSVNNRIENGDVLNAGPTELTLRFSYGQIIDANTLSAITVWRAGNDGEFDNDEYQVPIGFIGVSDVNKNEVIIRFAETLVDDQYEIRIHGKKIDDKDVVLTNIFGSPYGADEDSDEGKDDVFAFELDLAPMVTTVVPMPTVASGGEIIQHRDRVDVYFNNDKLDETTANNVSFYQLILTNDTADTADDVVIYPISAKYEWDEEARLGKVVLKFEKDLAEYGEGSFRLRVGDRYRVDSDGVPTQYETFAIMEEFMMTDRTLTDATDSFADARSFEPSAINDGIELYVEYRKQLVNFAWIRGEITTDERDSAIAMWNAYQAEHQANLNANYTEFGKRKAGDAGQTLVIEGEISPFTRPIAGVNHAYNDYNSVWPGGNDEPGHRLHVTGDGGFDGLDSEQHLPGWDYAQVLGNPSDQTPGITLAYYHFPITITGADGRTYFNLMTDLQKDGTRQVLAMISQYMGIQFVEVATNPDGSTPAFAADNAIQLCVGDMAILGGTSDPGGVIGLGGGLRVVLDASTPDFGSSDSGFLGTGFTHTMMHEIMHCLGFGHTYDLDVGTVMGDLGGTAANMYGDGYYNSGTDINAAYPGNNDITHGQYLYRLDGMDIDLHKFTLATNGTFSAEIVAERQASMLDAVLILFDAKGNVIARNDDYFSNDSFMELELDAGIYYIGVSSKGNDSYDPTIANSGMYGNTEGTYQLRLNYMPVNDGTGIMDETGRMLDGDLDGHAGGAYNTWFDVRSMENTVYVDKGTTVDGSGKITGQRKIYGMVGGMKLPTETTVYRNIDDALTAAAAKVTDTNNVAVRILGNNYANDSNEYAYDGSARTTQDGNLEDNLAYEVGWKMEGGVPVALEDGNMFWVPGGVNVTIDEGVVIKLRQANIEVGSREVGDDRSEASLQILGTPYNPVYLTSYNDESIGTDLNATNQSPLIGDWGGVVFRNKADYEHNADRTKVDRIILEEEGIFINTVAFADIRYAGGRVNDSGAPVTAYQSGTAYTALYMQEARPDLVFNTLTRNANAAMSADPNSFKESTYHDSSRLNEPQSAELYTSDYNRVGPVIRGNNLTLTVEETNAQGLPVTNVHTNSLNGILVRIETATGKSAETLDVTARFDDFDIVHILTENLTITGDTTGSLIEFKEVNNPQAPVEMIITARPDGGLHIDSGIIVKLNNAIIDVQTGAHLIAEASAMEPVIFTSIYDDSYGAGGVFDTSNNKDRVKPGEDKNLDGKMDGDWGGIYLQPDASAFFDYARFMYAGGTATVGGEYANFNTIEARQAFLRVANSVFEYNDANAGQSSRLGYGVSGNAVLNIMNSQPVIVNNQFLNNDGAVISINANSMWSTLNKDPGRATGSQAVSENIQAGDDQIKDAKMNTYKPVYSEYSDNSGPLVRENRMQGNTINGMIVRGETLTTECTWDDADITHVVFDLITIPNFHTYGGLRLQSSSEGSLVVKFHGGEAGITAAGSPADIDDRAGGRLQVIGVPNYPVIMTSLHDSTVGSVRDLNGKIDYKTIDTNKNPEYAYAEENAWQGIVFDRYSHDRNVETVIETEFSSGGVAVNDTTPTAQYIGALAGNLNSGDENLRLGFEIHGSIQTDRRSDVDVYAFTGTPGQEIWIDVDETDYNLDTKIELIYFDASGKDTGKPYAVSTYSVNENDPLSGNAKALSSDAINAGVVEKLDNNAILFAQICAEANVTNLPFGATYATLTNVQALAIQKTNRWTQLKTEVTAEFLSQGYASSMETDSWNLDCRDYYSINLKDAGMRVVLPGSLDGSQYVYYLRVSSHVPDYLLYQTDRNGEALLDANGDKIPLPADKVFNAGKTGGRYLIQLRLQETQEIAGSMVSYADIRYAVNGITVNGMPLNSPLTTETGDLEGWAGGAINDTITNAQPIGNVLETNHATITVSGVIDNGLDVDWYQFDVEIPGTQQGATVTRYPVEFDIDYADGMGRPDLNIWVFDAATGELILSGTGAELVDDMNPLTGKAALNNGSFGSNDSTIGPIYLPVGSYYVAVALAGRTPAILNNNLVRQEPVESIYRIVEDHIGGLPLPSTNAPAAETYSLGLRPEAYAFSDVVMYICQGGDLISVNPFTGQHMVDWTSTNPANGSLGEAFYGDIYMRNDGRMFTMPNRVLPNGQWIEPQFHELNLGDARIRLQDVSTELYARLPAQNPPDVVAGNSYVASIEALVSGQGIVVGASRINRGFYGVGNVDVSHNYANTGNPAVRNLLWAFNEDGSAVLYPRADADQDRLPTNPIPLAQLYTSPTFWFTQATDTLFNRFANNPIQTFDTPGDIFDGTEITIDYREIGDEADVTRRVTFEMDAGYDLELTPQGVVGPSRIQDGDTFTITSEGRTYTFEFDSGAVISIPEIVHDEELGQLTLEDWFRARYLGDGNPHLMFVVTNMDTGISTLYEFFNSADAGDAQRNERATGIDIANVFEQANEGGTSAQQILAVLVADAIGDNASAYYWDIDGNNQENFDGWNRGTEPWNVSISGNFRVTLNWLGADPPTEGSENYLGNGFDMPGIVTLGNFGIMPGNIRIPFDPMHGTGEYLLADQLLGESIVNTINSTAGLEGRVYAGYAYRSGEEVGADGQVSIYNRTVGDRITISGITPITVVVDSRAASTEIRSTGAMNDFIITGMSPLQDAPENAGVDPLDISEHNALFFNGVNIIFRPTAGEPEVRMEYDEVWDVDTERLVPSDLVIYYNPTVHTAADIVAAVNAFTFTSRHGTDPFHPFRAGLIQPDSASAVDILNDGSGLLLLGYDHTIAMFGGHRGTPGLTHRNNIDGTIAVDGVKEGSYRVRIAADMTGEEIAEAFAVAVNAWAAAPNNGFYGAIVENGSTILVANPNFYGVVVQESIVVSTNPVENDQLYRNIRFEGEGTGGIITGMAWLHGGESNDELYVVTDDGSLYRIHGVAAQAPAIGVGHYNFELYDVEDEYKNIRLKNGNLPIRTEYITTLTNANGQRINFTSLSNGPQHVENRAYSNFLFAVDAAGLMYCFDTRGNFQNVFYDGNSSIFVGQGVSGMSFSPIDFNLWSETGARSGDAGHGINPTYTDTRIDNTPGGGSMQYGMETSAGPMVNMLYNDVFVNYNGTNPGALNTYDTPGGNSGSLVTDEFSLQGYAAGDQPFMTFNYFVDTEGHHFVDSFRVYITSTDPAFENYLPPDDTSLADNPLVNNQLAVPQWVLLASNNDIGVRIVDQGGGWFQCVINLGGYAGLTNLKLRFTFSTSGIIGVGDTATVGDWLYTLPGYRMSSGDTITIATRDNAVSPAQFQDFEFLMGHKVLLPGSAGAQVNTGDYISVTDRNDNRYNFYFVKDQDGDIIPGVEGMNVRVAITSSMSSAVVADLIRVAINNVMGGLGIDASDVTIEDTIIDEQNVFISGAKSVTVSTGTPVAGSVASVDGEEQMNQINAIAMETTDRIQFTPFQLDEAEMWVAGNGYSFTVTDRYTQVFDPRVGEWVPQKVVFFLVTQPGTQPPIAAPDERVVVVDLRTFSNNRTFIPGDVDGDEDFDTQDLISILSMQVANSGLVGLTAYATGDCLMIKGANWVTVPVIGPAIAHTWKTGGDTLLNPEAFPIRYTINGDELTFASTDAEFARAISLAMENCYNSYRLQLGAPDATDVLLTNDTFIVDVSDGTVLNNEIRYVIQRGDEVVTVPNLPGDMVDNPEWEMEVHIIQVAENATTWEVAHALRDALNAEHATTGHLFEVVQRNGQISLVYTPIQLAADLTFVTIFDDVVASESLQRLNLFTASKYRAGETNKVNIIGSEGMQSRVLMSSGPLPFMNKLQNDLHVHNDNMMQGQNNRHEGIYVDDIIIGFRERGTMYTGSPSGNTTTEVTDPETGEVTVVAGFNEALYAFSNTIPAGAVQHGEYQLQIRQASDFAVLASVTPLKLNLMRAFNTNDRFVQELSLQATQGSQIAHLDIFTIGDGTQEIQFQFILASEANNVGINYATGYADSGRTAAGAHPIFYNGTETPAQIARLIVSAVNKAYSVYVEGHEQHFNVLAYLQGDGGTGVVDLVGAAEIKVYGASLFEMIKHNDDTDASYQGAMLGIFVGNEFTSRGDRNTAKAQGLIYINSNVIAYSQENGIQILSGNRDMSENYPYPGATATLTTKNAGNLVSGVAIVNNVIAFSGNAGIYMDGDVGTGANQGARLFAHVVNNTVWGKGATAGGFGIYVGENMGPTLLNNVVANNTYGVYVEDSSFANTVIGHNAFARNMIEGYTGESYILIGNNEPLFVSPNTLNFYPMRGSKIIDSARDSLNDRLAFQNYRATLGIDPSPIIAPSIDVYGQTRTDDPGTSNHVGGGMTSFKDIGAVDRVDFEGPTAHLMTPRDNGERDENALWGDVVLRLFKEDRFVIQLLDNGTGINDASVTSAALQLYVWPINPDYVNDTPVMLRPDVDYKFDYDLVTDTITLYPVTGTWRSGVTYQIVLANSAAVDPRNFISDRAGNELQANRPNGNTERDALYANTTQFWVEISGMDFGDAPDPTYPSLLESNGARHIINAGYYMGDGVSNETNARLNGDTYDDGVILPFDAQMKTGSTVTVSIHVTSDGRFEDPVTGVVGYVNAWIDLNNDGEWDNDLDYVLKDVPVMAGDNSIKINIPAGLVADGEAFFDSYARFRLTSKPMADLRLNLAEGQVLDYRGEAPDGEVEDYKIRIVKQYYDYGDAPEFCDVNLQSAARHIINYDANGNFMGPYLGTRGVNLPDAEQEPKWSDNADGDDRYGLPDENGVIFGPVVSGQSISMTFNAQRNNTAQQVYINVWMDFHRNGNWTQVLTNCEVTKDGQLLAVSDSGFEVPVVDDSDYAYVRVRISTVKDLGPLGEAPNGEVEDYLVPIVTTPMDFGDAPRSYGVLKDEHGPYHEISLKEKFYLGIDNGEPLYVGVDHELDGFPSENADGDDTNGAYNDENGVKFERLVPGRTTTITVETTGEWGYLYAWLDFNRNGIFDPEEAIIYNTAEPAPTSNEDVLGWYFENEGVEDPETGEMIYTGVHTFDVFIPEDTGAGVTYARFRLSEHARLAEGPLGDGGRGEVEDYKITLELGDGSISGSVFNDLNNNGQWDMQVDTQIPNFNFLPTTQINRVDRTATGQYREFVQTNLGFEFEYFGSSYRSIWISVDGYVQFAPTFTPLKVGDTPEVPTIAVFWADVDTQNNGGVVSYDRGVATNGNRYFQVTWTNVVAANTLTTETKSNTFVLYLEQSTGGDIVAMRYDRLQWASAPDALYAEWNGFGGDPAIAGFYSGTGTVIEIATVSVPNDTRRLLDKVSNNIRGCHAYRFDPTTGLPGGREPGVAMYDTYANGQYMNHNIRVYIDDNNNGILDTDADGKYLELWTYVMLDDPATAQNELGYFQFAGLFAGDYIIRMEELQGDMWVSTSPTRTAPINEGDPMVLAVKELVEHASTFELTMTTQTGSQRTYTFVFIDVLQDDQTVNPPGAIPIYYNSGETTVNDLAALITAAINNIFGRDTAKSVMDVVTITKGVYDLKLGALESKIAIQSSHSRPSDKTNEAGYYHVILSGDEQFSGVDFGIFRKGEIHIISTEITEGNSGETIVRVGVELSGSYGAEYGFYYYTDSVATGGKEVGYYCLNNDPDQGPDTSRPIYAGQAVAGENGDIIGYYKPGITVVAPDGSLFMTTTDLNNPLNQIKADYRAASGYYEFISTPQGAPASTWVPIEITNTPNYNNYDARISGSRIAYAGADNVDGVTQKREVYVYDHNVGGVIWSSGNQVNNNYIDIYGDWVVWSQEVEYIINDRAEMRYQLFAYNLETNVTVQVTDNGTDNRNARISGTNVIWEQVIQVPGGTATRLMMANILGNPLLEAKMIYETSDLYTVDVDSICIDTASTGIAHAVWTVRSTVDTSSTKVWYYDGRNSYQATPGSSANESNPQVDNGIIVFQSKDTTSKAENIYYFIIGESVSSQLLRSTGSYDNVNPQISNGIVVWAARDMITKSKDIFYCDLNAGTRPTNITNSPQQDELPSISGNRIAWRSEPNSLTAQGGYAWDIYFYEIGTGTISRNITQTDRNDNFPMISEDMIVWRTYDQATNAWQICVATEVPGRLIEYIEVVIYGDLTIEQDELFALILREVEGGNVIIRDGYAVVNILNDDGAMDYGEAAETSDKNQTLYTYPTKLADNGARHNANSGYAMGKNIDAEPDGFPLQQSGGSLVLNDSGLGKKDTDGVTLPEVFVPGTMATIVVNVTLPAGVDEARLDAWIDFNHNGSWLDSGDQILTSYTVTRGDNYITIPVPRSSFEGETWARFRLSAEGGLAPTGYCITGEVEDYKVTISRTQKQTQRTLTINGDTIGMDDRFEFRVLDNYKQFQIVTNQGATTYNMADYDRITFDGLTGTNDSFLFVGGEKAENMLLWPNQGFIFIPGDGVNMGLSINVVGVNSILVEGNGGADTVDIYGSYRNDILTDVIVNGQRQVTMTEQTLGGRDSAYSTQVKNLDMAQASVTVYSTQGGIDTAVLDSILVGDSVRVEGDALTVTNAAKRVVTRMFGFENLIVNDTTGKAELILHSTSVTETVTADQDQITLNSLNRSQELNGFHNVSIYGSNGNAVLYDTDGDDLIVVYPNAATMTDTAGSYHISLQGFADIKVEEKYGGDDSVTIHGSDGDDTLIMGRQEAVMYGESYSTTVTGFQFINAYAGEGGNDQARMYDAKGDNRVVAQGQSTEMYGLDYYNRVVGFSNTYVYAVHGSNNKATLYDTFADDTVVSYSEYTNMYSQDYYNQIFGFNSVDIIATSGGTNTARLYDSAMGDLLEAGSNWASMTSGNDAVTRTISDFDIVEAVAKSTSSVNTADASAIDFLFATGKWKK